MNGSVHSSLYVFCLAVLCANLAHGCRPFRKDGDSECDKVNACEFVCFDNRDRLLANLKTGKFTCDDETVQYARAVVERDHHNCAADIKQALIDSNTEACAFPPDAKVATCNSKLWFTRRQTILTTVTTAYVVAINLISAVL